MSRLIRKPESLPFIHPQSVRPNLAEATIHGILKLSKHAKECNDPEERKKASAALEKLAELHNMDGPTLVSIAKE